MAEYKELIQTLRSQASCVANFERMYGECGAASMLAQAADAIEELQRENAELRQECDSNNDIIRELDNARQRWIPVTERLPEDGYYLCFIKSLNYKGKYYMYVLRCSSEQFAECGDFAN